jgi:hypothetical protein
VHELLRTSNLVRLNFLVVLLKDSGIEAVLLDAETSLAFAGGPMVPVRLAVAEADAARASAVLREAGELEPGET